MRLIGIFGGTFDPVHCGHLRAMVELQDALAVDEVRIVPCGTPPHRAAPLAPEDARVAMLEAALVDVPRCTIDRREMERPGPSYMVDTLASMREQWPDDALCLMLGQDAYCGLPRWRRWREVFDHAHIAVARRPGGRVEVPAALAAEADARGAPDVATLRRAPAGCVIYCETSQLEISSSHLRSLAAAGRSLRWLVPDAVDALIRGNGWYRDHGRVDDRQADR